MYTYCTCVKVRGQLALIGSLIPLCKSKGLNSGHRLDSESLYLLSLLVLYHLLYKKVRGYRNFDKSYHFFFPKMFVPVCLPSVLETPFYHTFDKSRCHLIELHTKLIGKRGCFFLSVVVLMQHPCFLLFLYFSEGSFSLVYKLFLPSFPSVG